MKKIGVMLALVLCMGLTAGCGESYGADENTVFVQKDGTVVSTDVEEFDENTYDQKGLEEYIKKEIEDYNGENGKDLVKLRKLSLKDQRAQLTLAYQTPSDYRKFTGIDFFAGSVAEALAAGYSFDVDFASVTDGKIASCDSGAFINDPDYKVVIIKGNVTVKVKGKIAFLSTANTNYVDASTVSIREGTSLLDWEKAEETEAAKETEMTQETQASTETVGAADTQSVSADELLESTEESSTEFEFDETEDGTSQADSEISNVYTYIVYK